MARRLRPPPTPTAPAPAPAPMPVAAPAPLAPVPQTQTQLPASLAQLGAWEETETTAMVVSGGPGDGAPDLRFNSGKGQDQSFLPPGTPLATPYVVDGDVRLPVPGAAVCCLREQPYWATHDDQYRRLAVWPTKPTFREFQGKRVDECAFAILLLLPGAQPLPQPVQPAMLVLATLRNATMGVLRSTLASTREATTQEWATSHGRITEALGPRLRQPCVLTGAARTARGSGYTYVQADGRPAPCSTIQLEAIAAWYGDPAGQEELAEMHELLDARVLELETQARATAEAH